MYAFSVNKKMDYSIPIIFKPQLQYSTLKTPKVKITTSSFAKASADKPKVAAYKPTTITKAIKTEPIKKQTEKATTIASDSAKATSDKAKKVEAKKIVEPVKKTVPAEAIKPVIPEKIEPAQKIEPASAQAIADRPKKEIASAPAEKKEPPLATAQPTPAEIPIRNVMEDGVKNAQVSNNFREVEALRRGAQLQKELVQKWQPPIGVSPDCACDISFFVNKQGTIENLKMVKSSGVMMFDISARQALFAMKMPQWTYGKPLIINFKQ